MVAIALLNAFVTTAWMIILTKIWSYNLQRTESGVRRDSILAAALGTPAPKYDEVMTPLKTSIRLRTNVSTIIVTGTFLLDARMVSLLPKSGSLSHLDSSLMFLVACMSVPQMILIWQLLRVRGLCRLSPLDSPPLAAQGA